jgi:hypothetical protein
MKSSVAVNLPQNIKSTGLEVSLKLACYLLTFKKPPAIFAVRLNRWLWLALFF